MAQAHAQAQAQHRIIIGMGVLDTTFNLVGGLDRGDFLDIEYSKLIVAF